ncbi:YcnI family protein [Paenibacillus oenotherae]|uniref:YcnI family protein n=1 Tax=Paenibacillus oenotherae TaxID=1435645 RepID=A0ABS7D3P2_9BACL|nr:YcnI family protein [Paenibacillus oenotherae]MBW7474448.1 YcnI family protein [Paenibacillus oenotherae]
MKQMKQWVIMTAIVTSLFLYAGLASAHVTVQPKETKQGSYEVFTVRVPSEKEEVTTKSVKVTIAEGVEFKRIEPKAGWKYELETTGDGIVKSVTWTAEGDGLTHTEFGEFRMQGKVAADAKDLVWKAYQTYSDGEVVEWIGAPNTDAKYPASLTVVNAGTAEGDGHSLGGNASGGGDAADKAAANTGGAEASNTAGDTTAPAADGVQSAGGAVEGDNDGGAMTTATFILSITACIVSIAALVMTMARRRKA